MEYCEIPKRIGMNTNAVYEIPCWHSHRKVYARFSDDKASYEIGDVHYGTSLNEFNEDFRQITLRTETHDGNYLAFQTIICPKDGPDTVKLHLRHYDNGGAMFCPYAQAIDLLVEKYSSKKKNGRTECRVSITIHANSYLAFAESDTYMSDERKSELLSFDLSEDWFALSNKPRVVLKALAKTILKGEPKPVKAAKLPKAYGNSKMQFFTYETAPRHQIFMYRDTAFLPPEKEPKSGDWFVSYYGESCFLSKKTIPAKKLRDYCKNHGLQMYVVYCNSHNQQDSIYEKQIRICIGKNIYFSVSSEDGIIIARNDHCLALFSQEENATSASFSIFLENQDPTIEFLPVSACINDDYYFQLPEDYDWQQAIIDELERPLKD